MGNRFPSHGKSFHGLKALEVSSVVRNFLNSLHISEYTSFGTAIANSNLEFETSFRGIEMSEISAKREEAESKSAKSVEKKIILRDFRELRQTVTALEANWETSIEEFNTQVQEKATQIHDLEEGLKEMKREHQKEIQNLTRQVEQRDLQVDSLRDEAEKLRHTITSLAKDKKALVQESSELKGQFQESMDRLEVLNQEIAGKDERLEDVEQKRQALVEKLEAEIQVKSTRIGDLEEEIRNLEGEYHQKAEVLDEILKSLTSRGRDHVTNKLLQDLTRERPFLLKVACPHCKGRISHRFKVKAEVKEFQFPKFS